jgi:hypothetical protein
MRNNATLACRATMEASSGHLEETGSSACNEAPKGVPANSGAIEFGTGVRMRITGGQSDRPDDLWPIVRRYTGRESRDERQRIAESRPDILLTNFMMAELRLTRQDDLDSKFIENANGPSLIVLDELHTYRGRQGADVAILVRRPRHRCAPNKHASGELNAAVETVGLIGSDDIFRNWLVAMAKSRFGSESDVLKE